MGSEELVSYRMYQLDKVVTEIKELYDVTSTKTMSDLLLAYSGHMNRVLKDLKVIKQDAAHEKFELRKHQRIKTLTEKVNWFETETLHFKDEHKK